MEHKSINPKIEADFEDDWEQPNQSTLDELLGRKHKIKISFNKNHAKLFSSGRLCFTNILHKPKF
jgi:hypothetical protein